MKRKVTNTNTKLKLASFQEGFIILVRFPPVPCLASLRPLEILTQETQTSSTDLSWEFVRTADSQPTSNPPAQKPLGVRLSDLHFGKHFR